MSYTIPTSVQTKAEAVLAVASAIADEDMGARYDGTVNTSLDVLADVLAAQDVQVPQTNAGAILALAQYAHGGGGGTDYTINVYEIPEGSEQPVASSKKVYLAEYRDNKFVATQDAATSAPAGTVIATDATNSISYVLSSLDESGMIYVNGSTFVVGSFKSFIMPAHDVYVILAAK